MAENECMVYGTAEERILILTLITSAKSKVKNQSGE